jgi:hypothetical protein
MERAPDTTPARAVRAAAACAAALALAIIMTWPLAAGLGRLGRITTMDGLWSIWSVTWVARTLVSDPINLYNANIFYPHRGALAFSEANIGAGVVAAPTWWLTRNPFAAHNTAVLFAFASTLLGMWLLTRRLSGDSAAAAVAAIMFAFCPYLFAHSAHIQLLMAGGIPLALLALHRLADAPSPRRGALLGLALAAQALACAYYGIFAGMMVGYGVLFLAVSRGMWRAPRFWTAVAIAAATSILVLIPFFLPYLQLQREEGFARTLDDARRYSATWTTYLATSAHAHRSVLALARRLGWRMSEVLFPGILALICGAAGAALGLRATRRAAESRDRETVLLYGSLGLLALWASFGPAAGLYTAMFRAIPLFTFLRAPARFGLIVVFVLALLSAIALRQLFTRAGRWRSLAAALVGLAAVAELNVLPFPWERAVSISQNYALLAKMPRAPVAEFPFYGERIAFPLHTQYMVFSTAHWMPLINGYSDHIPDDFREAAFVLGSFPSTDAFAVLRRHRARYLGIHWDMYGPRAEDIRTRLAPFTRHLRPLASDGTMTLYEIVSFP